MNDGNGLAEAVLGLDGFRVLEVSETPEQLIVRVETMATVGRMRPVWDPRRIP